VKDRRKIIRKNVFHRFKTVMLSVDGTPDVPVAPNLIDLHAVTP
jgi:hypothetical protein